MAKYVIGIDFGSLSGRAVLLDVATGEELGSSVMEYPHAVMETEIPTGKKLPHDYSLQHPQDYLDVLQTVVPGVLEETGVSPDDVVGLGLDFTACTVLPTDNAGNPLVFSEEWQDEPMAYVMMWKHHGAQKYAEKLTEIAKEQGEGFLDRSGGRISSESLIPRLWQIAVENPKLYDAMDNYIEAGDWIVWQLTGEKTRNSCAAGYKALYDVKEGKYPDKEFYKLLDDKLENVVEEKLDGPVVPIGSKAGEINIRGAELTGLNPGTAVAVAHVDAHAGVPGAMKSIEPDQMLMIMGTSNCHMVISEEDRIIPGLFGISKDGIIPGYIGYEAGQSCVGDQFAWFVNNLVSEELKQEAKEKGIGVHELLTEKAEKQKPGEHGLIALDWWNGNRSILIDNDLTGMLLGMNLTTKPEDIYRALIESTAYGTREIIDNFEENGVPINKVYATGGIPMKNAMLMQIFADVCNKPMKLAGSEYGPAIGSAVMAAVAAGSENGGYDSVDEAAKVLAKEKETLYVPNPENVEIYDKLYKEYNTLHDYFGRGQNDVMKRLKTIKADVANKE